MTPRHPIPRPAIVRPDHRGRTHPDPRADPPTQAFDPATQAFDPANAPTVRLPAVVADTAQIPSVHGGGRIGEPPKPEDTASTGGLHDGLALSLSSLIGSAAGFVSWLIAARIMPLEQVGNAQLVVSAFILVGGAAQLNLGVGLMRWVPRAGRGTSKLVWGALLLLMPLAGVVGLVYALFTPRLAAISAGPGGLFAFGVLVFVLACSGWGVFVVHDFLLVALGKPWWSVWRNAIFAVVRIALLVVLGGTLALGEFGVVLSWVGPIVVWIVAGSLAIAVLTRKVTARATGDGAPSRAEMFAFLGPTAVSQLGASLLYYQVPVLVNVRYGPEIGIVFFIAWQAVMVIDLAAVFFMDSLSVAVGREPHRVGQLAAAARRRLLIIFLPALALGAALADPLLRIFGDAYAEADNVLRLLLLGLAFRLVVAHELGVRQAIGWGIGFARLQLISSVLVLFVAIVVPVAGGGVSALLPVAIGYVAVQVVAAAAVLLFPARRRADMEVRSP
jgi:O-antigen/teichoic acid export membrane protein